VDPLGVCCYDDMKLIDLKQNGGLVLPSRPVVMICRNTEIAVREMTATGLHPINLKKVENETIHNCISMDFFNMLHHKQAFDPFSSSHVMALTKMIIHAYATIRMCHETKEWTKIQKGISMRQDNKKNTLLQGM